MPSAAPATTTLSEAASKQLLATHGVATVPGITVPTASEAGVKANQLGFPVVVKLCGPAIAHKTERGLVRLRLVDADAVREAAGELLGLARPEDGTVELLVMPMVTGSRELIAGLHTDPQFGPCVMLGIGGVLAEAIGDVQFRLAPITPLDAAEMIDGLRAQALLGPFRGEPPIDRTALAEVLVGLSHVAEHDPDVMSVDLNPLVVVDGVPLAVDALVELRA
ncbi:MAG TPA: acetate--CoA ligase family protein [Acidimicrobiia bacterium]|nr:acetate--CoA ligase family protein [Acidimicrobiia bacterium]